MSSRALESLIVSGLAFAKLLARFKGDRRANVVMLFALTSPALIGALGLGMETAYWYVDQRAMQNASDAAAIAAAGDGTSNYSSVVGAVAQSYGYYDGVNGVTITSSNVARCPSGATNCYRVDITFKQPLYLMPVVGFNGDTTINGQSAQTLHASATARVGVTRPPSPLPSMD